MVKAPVNPFQLDENCSSKLLLRLCKVEGKCDALPFPKALRNTGKKDWQWFPTLLKAGAPIVTTDQTIAFEQQNIAAIPDNSAGILVIKPKHPIRAFGSKQATSIMSAFKGKFPEWAEVDWSNIYVEITDEDVCVRPLRTATQTPGETIRLIDSDLATRMHESIARAKVPIASQLPAG